MHNVFDQFGWNLEADELVYAAQKAGFKQGWVYFHTGERLQKTREEHEAQKREYENRRQQQAQRKAEQARQAQQEQMNRMEQERLRKAYGQAQQREQERMEVELRGQFEWLFRQAMRGFMETPGANGCPGYIEPAVRRFGLKWPYTAAELKKVYRQKCMETHPDRGGTDQAFQEVQKDNQELERYAQGGT